MRPKLRVPPLSLVLHPEAMDMRRLHCLVVGGQGDFQVVHVRKRDAVVAVLQYHLGTQLHVDGRDLVLFLARPAEGKGRDWVTSESVEAIALARMDATQLRSTGNKLLTQRNVMSSATLLHDYFPLQPSLYEGLLVAIHVLVCFPRVLLLSPSPPQSPMAIDGYVNHVREQTSELAGLIEIWKRAKIDTIKSRGQNAKGSTAFFPQLIRSLSHGCRLWLSGEEDQLDLTEIYVPTSWRLLSKEILSLLDKPIDDGAAARLWWPIGRRALVTGATGSGKSVFLVYLLIILARLRDPPVCVLDIPGVTYALLDTRYDTVVEGLRGVDFDEQLNDASTIYLFDGNSSEPDGAPLGVDEADARCIVILPPCFDSVMNKRTKTFVMPQWTNQDVHRCAKVCFAHSMTSDSMSQFQKWGGLPGRVFAVDSTADALENALRSLTPAKVMRMIMVMGSDSGWRKVANGPDAAVWKLLIVLVSATSDGCFEHDGHVAFTSQYVCDRVMELPTMRSGAIRQHEHLSQPRLWTQIRTSLQYLAQEEEEKSSEPLLPLFPKPKAKRVSSMSV